MMEVCIFCAVRTADEVKDFLMFIGIGCCLRIW